MLPLPVASSRISTHRVEPLVAGWQLLATAPGLYPHPDALPNGDWCNAVVPGTVAQTLHTDIGTPGLYDQQDWWYRTSFDRPEAAGQQQFRLRFDGLATLAEIWLNGSPVLTSDNMFLTHVVDVTPLLQSRNTLEICFRSLATQLEAKKPRPRWKTALTSHQNLRWFRTTLLGHIPSWCPPINPVGPWRPITLEAISDPDITDLDLQVSLAGNTGIVRLSATVTGTSPTRAILHVGERSEVVTITPQAAGQLLSVTLEWPDAPRWWPHTHGDPTLLPCRIELIGNDSAAQIDCGDIGFRSIRMDRSAGGVSFLINDVPVFCRGACWTSDDIMSLAGNPESLQQSLQLARDANMNMVRIGGTMIYESDWFYTLCDRLGILVWQDFMFANMDYPVSDAAFLHSIKTEATQQLQRLQHHPCMAAYCAGSEIEQQAAMLGLPESEWSNSFFAETLPALCNQWHAGVPYFRGSPSEGPLPFHLSTGISHYYGVGAYRRPLADAKHAGVRFTTECLGFSNVPDAETMALVCDGATPVPHHPRWKARVPRDHDTPWDFEDIRDFYLRELFDVDPVALRSENLDRYYALARVATGEVMLRTFAEWRRAANPCNGALVWFYKDFWPGAGWGVIDSENHPKSVYHYLRRAWAPQTLLLTDDGLDGIELHIVNDAAAELKAEVQLELLQYGKIRTLETRMPVSIAPRSALELSAEAMAGHFTDSSYAYRFGPPKHDTVIGRLLAAGSAEVIAEDFYFPQGLTLPPQDTDNISTQATMQPDGSVIVTLASAKLLQSVTLTASGFMPSINCFHAAPGQEYQIEFKPTRPGLKKFKAYLDALNLRDSLTLRTESAST